MKTYAVWRNYYELCKPRVVALMLLTSIVGMLLATDHIPWQILFFGTLGIGLCAGAGGVINQLIDHRIDSVMGRTKRRPIPSGNISPSKAGIFAFILSLSGMSILIFFVNTLTAILTFATLVGYAFIYTVFLKRATPQNIVIGGLAGATPPLLGWTAVTASTDPAILLLVLLIFTWTPPHFWSLAIARYEEYKKAEIPMLPVTHGVPFTKLCIVLYTLLMVIISIMPFIINMSGVPYLIGALILGGVFLIKSCQLYKSNNPQVAMNTFYFSIFYLMAMFLLLLTDHYLNVLGGFHV
ncbi:MAG: protoheme IX farnesyltransferase [Gammaproteobacteria bacterium]|nr:protoheme IX farnesyltransferase [Gammaproteobacteria bacterium]